MPIEVAKDPLILFENVNKITNLFYKERLISNKAKLHAPVHKTNIIYLFADAVK